MSQGLLLPEFAPMPGSEQIKNELRSQGYANLPFAFGKVACQELFDNFADFVKLCQEPDGNKLSEAVRFNVNGQSSGAYHLEYREPGKSNSNEPDRQPGKDHKWIFHYGSQTIERATRALGGALPKEMQACLDNCDEFYDESRRVMRVGAAALGLEHVMFTESRSEDVHVLRLIEYLGTLLGTLGEEHFDRALLTLADEENQSGLIGAPGNNGHRKPVSKRYIRWLKANMRPIGHQEHQAKLFAGAGLNRLPDHIFERVSDIPLLGHGITNNHPGQKRRAVVFFGNPHQRFTNYTVPTSYETGFSDILTQL